MSKSNLRRPAFVLLLLVVLAAGVLWSYWLLVAAEVSVLAASNPPTTALMEARLEEARRQGLSYQRDWTWTPLASISSHLQRAVIIAEDWSFYGHRGFDWEGIREALLHNVSAGRLRRGGSTITQQLAKNLFLSSDKTLPRKAREAVITLALERHLGKSRILELYLNVAEWGRGIYGAEAAARHHFGKSARDLTREEAALLAAVLPAPRSYDPLRVTRRVSLRQQHILRWMKPANGKVLTPPEPIIELPPEELVPEEKPVPGEPVVEPAINAPSAEEPPAEPSLEPFSDRSEGHLERDGKEGIHAP